MGTNHSYVGFWDLGFFELWHPLMILVLIIIGYLYIKAVRSRETHYAKNMFFFLSGLFLFYVSEGSPLKAFGHHYLFTAHMLSMSITYFAVAPLILAGLFEWMIIPVLKVRWIKKFVHFITHPLLACALFNILLSFYHIPVIFNKIMLSGIAMTVANIILIFFAFVMWWLIITPNIVGIRRLKPMPKIGYVFAASILLTPACAMIMFSDGVMYHTIASEPRVIGIFSHLADQRSGGVIMKIFQEIVFVCTLGYIFIQWARTDRDPEANDLNPKPNYLANK